MSASAKGAVNHMHDGCFQSRSSMKSYAGRGVREALRFRSVNRACAMISEKRNICKKDGMRLRVRAFDFGAGARDM